MKKNGFTLIELLVVISIIGFLATLIMVSLDSARVKARDTRRKADLVEITKALDLYYDQNNSYPSTGATDANNNGTYSTQGAWLSSLVSAKFMSKAPADPINIDKGPWCWAGSTTKNTIYTYASDGQKYVLCAWMENTSDKNTLQFNDVPNPWNTSQKLYANMNYSGYNYVFVKY